MGCGESRVDSDANKKPVVVFILGGPGSGKGTQCAKITQKFGFTHLSTGDLLREEVANKGPNAEVIAKFQADGKLVSSEILVKIIKGRILKNPGEKILLDGFPRSQENQDCWDKIIGDCAICPFLVYFNCSKETMKERIMGRAKASTVVRADDNEEAIEKRLNVFTEQTVPIVEKYQKDGKCCEISCESSPNEVFEEVCKTFTSKGFKPIPTVIFVLGGPGSGKGTQCAKIKEKYGYVHLSTGDLLRNEVANKGPAKIQADGKLVPSDILVKIIRDRIMLEPEKKYLLDGFPRSQENQDIWDRIIGKCAIVPFLLFFNCSKETMKARILGRAQASTEKRADDNEEAIEKRLNVYTEQTVPIVEKYQLDGKCCEVDCEKSPDEVFEDVCGMMAEKMK